jgi:hypothetical protein
MKYLISIFAAIVMFCGLLSLFLQLDTEPSLTLSCIFALFSWVIGYVVFLKFQSLETKAINKENIDNINALKSFRKNKDNHNESI